MAFYPNDMLTSAYLIGAVNGRLSKEAIKQNYRGEQLLPFEEVPERRVIWDIMFSENNLAGVYDPRGQAIPGNEILFDQSQATLADVKASRMLDKYSVQVLRDPGMATVYKSGGSSNIIKGIQGRVVDKINKRLAWCNEAVDSQMEYFAMQALQGNIVWPPVDNAGAAISTPPVHWNADMVLDIPFPLPAGQNQAVTTLTGYNGRTGSGLAWTNAASTPFDDLAIASQHMLKTFGTTLRGGVIYLSEVVLEHMATNTSIVNWIAGASKEQTGARGFADIKSMEDAIKTQFGWTIETYDSQWTHPVKNPGTKATIQRVDFLKEGKVLIMPPGGPVGTMMTAPQEAEPNGQWVWGKMGWQYTAPKPPFDVELGVNIVAWPKFENTDWFVLDSYS